MKHKRKYFYIPHQDEEEYTYASNYKKKNSNVIRLTKEPLGGDTTKEYSNIDTMKEHSDTHTEGIGTKALKSGAHAEGIFSIAKAEGAHAEGQGSEALREYAHAQGEQTKANGASAHSEGQQTRANGDASHSEGYNTLTEGFASHAEGIETKAYEEACHSEGWDTEAKGLCSHTQGHKTCADNKYAHAQGLYTQSRGIASHAQGSETCAEGFASHAQGYDTKANGDYSMSEGKGTCTNGFCGAHIMGKYGEADEPYSFYVANGVNDENKNIAAKISANTADVCIDGGYSSFYSGYAEMFETIHEPIDYGYFVTLEGRKIRKATDQDEYILGVIVGNAALLGENKVFRWKDKYQTDEWGNIEYEKVRVRAIKDPNGQLLTGEKKEVQQILNPDWENNQEYSSRMEREEWQSVGLYGQLMVRDDGTCKVNGYCRVNEDGIATLALQGYRVLERVSKNQIIILFR